MSREERDKNRLMSRGGREGWQTHVRDAQCSGSNFGFVG